MTYIASHPQQSNIWWVFLLQGTAGIMLGLIFFDAKRVLGVLGKRLARYGLTLHPDKTRFVDFRNNRPNGTDQAITTLLGFYWLFMGVISLVQVFVDRSTPWIWSLLTGIVGILAGLFVLRHFVLRHPLFAALTVPTVLVIFCSTDGAHGACDNPRC
jgi:uncharacterized membrane protein HdeD (DUF308 family)